MEKVIKVFFVPRDLEALEHKINGYPGITVEHFYVRFGDPNDKNTDDNDNDNNNNNALNIHSSLHKCIFIYKYTYLIYFFPKSVFQNLLLLPQFLLVSKQVKMRQNTNYLWEAVNLTDVDKFESFHLIIKASINQQ